MFQDITLEEWALLRQKKELIPIDVRSPSEYEDASVPGSLNIPLFDDEERAEIGTLYKQESVQAAKDRGLEIVSAKLPAFIKQFAEIPQKKAVFCWRGGMRSKTTATVLSLMDIHVYRLAGGYRAYRQWVMQMLQEMTFEPRAYVIHGHTGSGKTVLLRRLEKQGYPVLDLEAMADHRGSIFGQIGMKGHNQKTFDSLLLDELIAHRKSPYFLMEAESRRVGKITLPEMMIEKKEQGHHIWIDMPIEVRIQTILDDYQPWNYQEECIQAFHRIKARLHTPIAAEIEGFLNNGHFERAVELLLLHYYDPLYSFSDDQYKPEDMTVLRVQSIDEACLAVEQFIQKQQGAVVVP